MITVAPEAERLSPVSGLYGYNKSVLSISCLSSLLNCLLSNSPIGVIKIAHANTLTLLTWKDICRLFAEVWAMKENALWPFTFLLVHESMGFCLAGPLLRTHNPLTFPSHIHTNSPLIWSSHAEGPARDKGRTKRLAGRVCVCVCVTSLPLWTHRCQAV